MTQAPAMTALMYHALYENDEALAAMPVAERPYAVSTAQFEAHLDLIQAQGLEIINPLTDGFKPGVVLTFDDGHHSFYDHALPILQQRGLSALFFITPELIEQRSDFCSWSQLAEMAAAGMTLGAHGLTHRFFTELSEAELNHELLEAKATLEQQCEGLPIESLSFPGGRYRIDSLAVARKMGYRYCFSSDVGQITAEDFVESDLLSNEQARALNRVAIRQDTAMPTLLKMIHGDRSWFFQSQSVDRAKRLAKQLLGDSGYQRLYEQFFDRKGEIN